MRNEIKRVGDLLELDFLAFDEFSQLLQARRKELFCQLEIYISCWQ
jgi:hypothetical protein